MPPKAAFSVRHNPDQSRFEIQIDSQTAVLLYKLNAGIILFTSTQVPPELEGRGIGAALAKAGLEFAQANNLKVQTTCWFVSGYLERHPEYQSLQ